MPILKRTLFLIGLLLVGVTTQAQGFLSHFSLATGNGKVVLNWTIDAGNTCLGIEIVRSTDGQSFTPIGNIGGICGSINVPISYSFVDESPVPNQVNTYKLLLGLSVESEVLSVEIVDLGNARVQIRPNPMGDLGLIYIDNDGGDIRQLTLYDQNGRLLQQQFTVSDRFPIDLSSYPAGIFLFVIREQKSGQITAQGKILK